MLTLLPGITGLAQVNDIDMSDPVRLAEKDAESLATRSFLGDLHLIYRTIFQRAGSGDRVAQGDLLCVTGSTKADANPALERLNDTALRPQHFRQ